MNAEGPGSVDEAVGLVCTTFLETLSLSGDPEQTCDGIELNHEEDCEYSNPIVEPGSDGLPELHLDEAQDEEKLCATASASLQATDYETCEDLHGPPQSTDATICGWNFNMGSGWSADTSGSLVVESGGKSNKCSWPNSHSDTGCAVPGNPHMHWHNEDDMNKPHDVTATATDTPPLLDFREGVAAATLYYNQHGKCNTPAC